MHACRIGSLSIIAFITFVIQCTLIQLWIQYIYVYIYLISQM